MKLGHLSLKKIDAVLFESLYKQYDAVSEEIVPQNPLLFNVWLVLAPVKGIKNNSIQDPEKK